MKHGPAHTLDSRTIQNKFLLPLSAQCVGLCHGNPSKHTHAPTLGCLPRLTASVTVCSRPGKVMFLLTRRIMSTLDQKRSWNVSRKLHLHPAGISSIFPPPPLKPTPQKVLGCQAASGTVGPGKPEHQMALLRGQLET